MNIWRLLRLYCECFKLAQIVGLLACRDYLCGRLVLPDLDPESLDLILGDANA